MSENAVEHVSLFSSEQMPECESTCKNMSEQLSGRLSVHVPSHFKICVRLSIGTISRLYVCQCLEGQNKWQNINRLHVRTNMNKCHHHISDHMSEHLSSWQKVLSIRIGPKRVIPEHFDHLWLVSFLVLQVFSCGFGGGAGSSPIGCEDLMKSCQGQGSPKSVCSIDHFVGYMSY